MTRIAAQPPLLAASLWLALIILTAIAAPFIASSRPIILHTLDASGAVVATEHPLFTSLWRDTLTPFDDAEREARGEIRAVRTLIPFSPNERPADRDASFLPPGASEHEPLARQIVADLPNDQRLDQDTVQRTLDRMEQLPIRADDRNRIHREITNLAASAAFDRQSLRKALELELNATGRVHLLGTDRHGQDVLSTLIHGCRLALSASLIAALFAAVLGVALGAIMGYFGGWIDLLLSRMVEIVMGVPLLFVLVLAAGVMPRSLEATLAIIACFTWTGAARFTRAEFMRLRDADFTLAARALALPRRSILFRHLLRNALSPAIIDAAFTMAAAVILEATLSYLGLGPPGRASWGTLLASATSDAGEYRWWLALFPGAAIFLTALSYNIIGEALRDHLDPRAR